MRLQLLSMTLAITVAACGGGSGSTSASTSAPAPAPAPAPAADPPAPPASGAGGGQPAAAPSIDGLWSSSTGMGGTLTMSLSTKSGGAESAVTGTGTYSVGATRSGAIAISGTYRPPAINLTVTYDNSEVVSIAATLVGTERLQGRLTYRDGSVVDIEFVRP